MEDFLGSVLNVGGPVAVIAVALIVIVAGLALRQKGWLAPEGSRLVSTTRLADLSAKVGEIDSRLRTVESDLQHLPTREEFHRMAVSMARLDTKLGGLEKTAAATNHAIGRIEDWMLDASKRGN